MNCDYTAKRNDIEENKRTKTGENAGFTLVEVMLAMAILTILTISLLNYFGTSLSYNTKMAAGKKATLFAQEIAEELKGQDTLIQARQETQPDGTSKKIYTIPYLLSGGYEVTQNDLNTSGMEGSGEISFKGEADKIQKDYDVLINVQSEENVWDEAKELYGFDNTNSILSADENQDSDALLYFKTLYSSQTLTDDEIKAKIKRTIDITISKSTAKTEYTVNVQYIYVASGLDPENSSSIDERTYNVLSASKISELKKLFIAYHIFNQEDYININNTTTDMDIPGTLYLIAQKKSASDSILSNYSIDITGADVSLIYSNIGTDASGTSHILKNGVVTAGVKKLSDDDFASVHKIDFEISVYEKGKAGVAGAKPYITINGTKGETP